MPNICQIYSIVLNSKQVSLFDRFNFLMKSTMPGGQSITTFQANWLGKGQLPPTTNSTRLVLLMSNPWLTNTPKKRSALQDASITISPPYDLGKLDIPFESKDKLFVHHRSPTLTNKLFTGTRKKLGFEGPMAARHQETKGKF